MGTAVPGEYRIELSHRLAWSVGMRPDSPDHRQKIGPSFDQWPAILRRYPANRTARDDRRFGPVAQQVRGRAVFRRELCDARKERAEGDIVGPGFRRDESAMAAVAAGHADNAVRSQQTTRLLIGGVLLADMHPVAIELGGKVGTIVHNERDITRLGNRLQNAGGAADRVVLQILEPQLQTGDIAASQRLVEFLRELVG